MKLIWTKPALNRLEEIYDYIARDKPEAAADFIDRLITATDQLIEFPEAGALTREARGIRHLVIDGYRILYEANSERVVVLNVISPGLNWP
jgi:addiction module RelE/StbE family toxin